MSAYDMYICSFCASGFTGENGRLKRDACEDLETPPHVFDVGDKLQRSDGPSSYVVVIVGKSYKRIRKGEKLFHQPLYRIIEHDNTKIKTQELLVRKYRLIPKLRIVGRNDPD